MITRKNTAKYKNLIANPKVSLLIDTRDEHPGKDRARNKALTVGGIFQQFDDPVKSAMVQKKLLGQHPHLQPFLDQPGVEIFALKITSFLFLDGIVDSHYVEL